MISESYLHPSLLPCLLRELGFGNLCLDIRCLWVSCLEKDMLIFILIKKCPSNELAERFMPWRCLNEDSTLDIGGLSPIILAPRQYNFVLFCEE